MLATSVLVLTWITPEDANEPELPDALPPPASFGEAEPDAPPIIAEPATPAEPSPPEIAALPPVPDVPVSACEDGELDRPVDRPTISELVAVRAQELDDRVRAAVRRPGVSPALRQGLLEALEPERQDAALAMIATAPDRIEDGFDHLAAVVSVIAWQALTGDSPRRARELARVAERGAPDDPLPYLVDALASEALGDLAGTMAALAEAFRLEPREPAVALAYLRRLRDTTELDAAVSAGSAYVADMPEDRQIARLLARLRMRRSAMASGTVRRLRGISLLAPAAVETGLTDRAMDVADRSLTEAARLLGVPRRDQLSLFVYRTHNELTVATCAPEWAAALYDGALHVDADRLATADSLTSLRHESLHAALHHAVPGSRPSGDPILPTWLDEGLAQYFAEEEALGAHRSFELMLRERTFVPMASMNGHFVVIDDPRDAGLAYHQALAMVLYLVDRRGERGIAEAVTYLQTGGDPDALMSGIGAPIDGESLLAFLEEHRRERR